MTQIQHSTELYKVFRQLFVQHDNNLSLNLSQPYDKADEKKLYKIVITTASDEEIAEGEDVPTTEVYSFEKIDLQDLYTIKDAFQKASLVAHGIEKE